MRRFEFAAVASADPAHPLVAADGAEVPGGRLRVHLGPRIIGSRYFRLDVDDGAGPVRFVQGLFAAGRYPGMNWAEIFDVDLPAAVPHAPGWEEALDPYLRPLADVIPPGGHLMIEYEKDLWSTTQLALLAGVPPIATPMGRLLHRLDCAGSIKDWYFPEGGQEGGRKLQGNRPLSPTHAAESRVARAAELRRWLDGPGLKHPMGVREDALRTLAELSR